jgi:hypothetical protein
VVELGGADYRCARSLAFRSQSAASTAEIAVATSPLRPRFTNATPQSFIRRGDLEGRMSGDDRAELALDQLYDRSISVGVAETALAADPDLDNDITVRSRSSVPSASGASVGISQAAAATRMRGASHGITCRIFRGGSTTAPGEPFRR